MAMEPFKVFCGVCGSELEVTNVSKYDDITVLPCSKCVKNEKKVYIEREVSPRGADEVYR